ncbi:hypothetical protein D3C76_1628850 [compost metagenome]
MHDTRLRCAVVTVACANTQPEYRSDVDDAAATTGVDQSLCSTLGNAPDTVEVGGQHAAPLFLADVQRAHCVADSGVVEHHIDHTETHFSRIESGLPHWRGQ